MPVSPILERQTTYPFVRLNEAARRVEERGIEVIDFGTGDPQEPTDPLIREALVDGLRERMGYPAAVGLPELREAIAAWAGRRFGVALDPDTEVIPTLGSKEAIFSFALAVVDAERGRATRSRTPTRGTRSTSAERSSRTHAPLALPLREENGFLPDLDAIDDETWTRLAVFWINYPNNPTCATAPLAFYERARRPGAQSTASCSPRTRPTRSSGSASRRRRRCRSPTGRTSSSSTRSRSAAR